jgi:DNA-binding protein YbaB
VNTAPTNWEACTVDELIDLAESATPEVFTRLAAVTATATEGGVTATVNLEGRLVALTIEPHALAAGPDPLAAAIFTLVQEASAAALNTGIEILTPATDETLAAELRALVLPTPAPKPVRRAPAPEEDFSTIESWALPH